MMEEESKANNSTRHPEARGNISRAALHLINWISIVNESSCICTTTAKSSNPSNPHRCMSSRRLTGDTTDTGQENTRQSHAYQVDSHVYVKS